MYTGISPLSCSSHSTYYGFTHYTLILSSTSSRSFLAVTIKAIFILYYINMLKKNNVGSKKVTTTKKNIKKKHFLTWDKCILLGLVFHPSNTHLFFNPPSILILQVLGHIIQQQFLTTFSWIDLFVTIEINISWICCHFLYEITLQLFSLLTCSLSPSSQAHTFWDKDESIISLLGWPKN